ncbi:MAG: Gx transporter family protein [Clostridia bacterium]|nr:Gx transporter family protein [Clostridia bacterium]
MKKQKTRITRTVALTGIFGAVALTLSFFEKFMLAALPLPPGVKPGLSNIAVLFTLSSFGLPYAMGIVAIKSFFSLLISGPTAALLSLCGGICSCFAMFLLLKIKKNGLSYTGISVVSAVLHNIGQLAAASAVTGTSLFRAYLPVLLISGIIFGAVTGILLNAVLPALEKLNNKIFSTHSGTERG